MLRITIPDIELFDPKTEEFFYMKEQKLQLEHSLVSISKWESKWCKPFLGNETKTNEQVLDYIKCMTITQNVKPTTYKYLPNNIINEIDEYINAKMTATWFSDENNKSFSKETITSEVIYYWMIAQNIPMECEKWHLNRLLTLIRVCGIKNQPQKKQNATLNKDQLTKRAALNAARRANLQTTG